MQSFTVVKGYTEITTEQSWVRSTVFRTFLCTVSYEPTNKMYKHVGLCGYMYAVQAWT